MKGGDLSELYLNSRAEEPSQHKAFVTGMSIREEEECHSKFDGLAELYYKKNSCGG